MLVKLASLVRLSRSLKITFGMSWGARTAQRMCNSVGGVSTAGDEDDDEAGGAVDEDVFLFPKYSNDAATCSAGAMPVPPARNATERADDGSVGVVLPSGCCSSMLPVLMSALDFLFSPTAFSSPIHHGYSHSNRGPLSQTTLSNGRVNNHLETSPVGSNLIKNLNSPSSPSTSPPACPPACPPVSLSASPRSLSRSIALASHPTSGNGVYLLATISSGCLNSTLHTPRAQNPPQLQFLLVPLFRSKFAGLRVNIADTQLAPFLGSAVISRETRVKGVNFSGSRAGAGSKEKLH